MSPVSVFGLNGLLRVRARHCARALNLIIVNNSPQNDEADHEQEQRGYCNDDQQRDLNPVPAHCLGRIAEERVNGGSSLKTVLP